MTAITTIRIDHDTLPDPLGRKNADAVADTIEGAARRIRTRLHLDRDADAYAAPRPRHSARAAARFILKLAREVRLLSELKRL